MEAVRIHPMASITRWCAAPRANPTSAPSGRPDRLRRRATNRRAVLARSISDPLSEKERAEFELLNRSASTLSGAQIAAQRAVEEKVAAMKPGEIRDAQQQEDFWAHQEDEYARLFVDRREYSDVMSEFRGDVVVQASPATCYALWNDLDALEFFLPGFRGERMADGVSANCSIEVTYGDSPERTAADTHRFMAHVTECEQDVVVHWQSTDGFPCGVVAGFWPNEDDSGGTRVRVEPYCHLPFDLAKTHGAMALSLDLENKLSAALEAFVFLADGVEKGMEAGVIDGVDGFKSDEHRFIPGTIPIGFGLTDGPAVRVGEDGAVFVDRRAMDAAAEDFEHRTGRKPLPVEVVKALNKAAGA